MIAAVTVPRVDWYSIAPIVMPVAAGILIILLRSIARDRIRTFEPALVIGMLGLAASAFFLAKQWSIVVDEGPADAMAHMTAVDGFSVFVGTVVIVSALLTLLLSSDYLVRRGIESRAEYVALLLFSVTGMLTMAAANDLIVVFVALEVLSIPLYVLAAYDRRRARSLEAGMKYFVLGAFSSAIFLYGVALMYGATGSTNLREIAAFLADNVVTHDAVLLAGMALLLVGLGFKVAAVPFHTWTPDVYQGSPTPATGFMAAAAKAAGFAGLLRVFFSTFHTLQLDWQPIIWVLAAVTLLVGSILAVVQTDIKRMLAYSSISHAGYVLIGLQAGSSRGIAGSLYYLLAYTFMVLGSFAVVTVVGRRGDDDHSLDAYRGLSTRRPALAMAFTILLLAQAGVPFTTGLWAKFYVIAAAVERGGSSYVLAVIGMLAAAISAFFYLRVTVLMYRSAPAGAGDDEVGAEREATPAARLRVPLGITTALVVTLAFTIAFGLV